VLEEMQEDARIQVKYSGKDIKDIKPKPFIKWVGGKKQLLPELQKRLPKDCSSYFEPFVGGGALMWTLNKSQWKRIVINDYNPELINLYKVVRERPEELLESLERHFNTREYFFQVRNLDRCASYEDLDSLSKASRFLYLNKTAFNGVWGVNSKGQSIVGYGYYKNPRAVDGDLVLACSSFLETVEILNGDFEITRNKIDADSFVYFDPPYVPFSGKSGFVNYTKNSSDAIIHTRIKNFCDDLNEAGVKWMLSNSSAPLVYDLYEGYNIEEVLVQRYISPKTSGRKKVTEVIIRNYD